jgi:hypothetical protein
VQNSKDLRAKHKDDGLMSRKLRGAFNKILQANGY